MSGKIYNENQYGSNFNNGRTSMIEFFFGGRRDVDPKKRRIGLLIIIGLLVILLIIFIPRKKPATVVAKNWTREVEIQTFKTVDEVSWEAPPEEAVINEVKEEMMPVYELVDHYERYVATRTRLVFDGYKEVEKEVKGEDGSVMTETIQVPQYSEETYTQQEKKVVYKPRERKEKRYYYTIDKWVTERTERTAGADDEPYLPEYELAEGEQAGPVNEVNILYLTNDEDGTVYTVEVSFELWDSVAAGDKVEITLEGTELTMVNGEVLDPEKINEPAKEE